MADSPLANRVVEQISNFLRTEAWQILKYRIGCDYVEANQKRVNANIRANDNERASYFLGIMDGAIETLDITERVVREINNGKLVVDVALNVIENKQREKSSK